MSGDALAESGNHKGWVLSKKRKRERSQGRDARGREKRRSRRVAIELPVRVFGDGGAECGDRARTQNIGSGGAYLEWSDTTPPPAPGQLLGLDIHMDAALTHKLSHVKVTAEAEVLRVEELGDETGGAGVAVRFKKKPRLLLN